MTRNKCSFKYILANKAETEALGASLAKIAAPGDIIALKGTLGSGKSVLARAFIRKYSKPAENIPSPTFTLVQSYDMGFVPVYHFDLYRIINPEETIELGIEEAFSDGISLIEWPERLGSYLPKDHLEIWLRVNNKDSTRNIRLAGSKSWQPRLHNLFSEETPNARSRQSNY